MTLLRAQLRHAVAEQVQKLCPTIAVVENRALTTYTAALPVVIFTAPMEHKESWGPGAPKFNATVSLAADIKASGSTEDVLERWEALAEMVELAVLGNAAVTRLVQEFSAVESHVIVSDEGGTPVASGRIVFQIVLPQVYDPAMPDRLLEIDIFCDAAMTEPGFVKIKLPQ